jgi:hypothetical protein
MTKTSTVGELKDIRTKEDFEAYVRTHELPEGFARDPEAYFTRQGTWPGWDAFLNVTPEEKVQLQRKREGNRSVKAERQGGRG